MLGMVLGTLGSMLGDNYDCALAVPAAACAGGVRGCPARCRCLGSRVSRPHPPGACGSASIPQRCGAAVLACTGGVSASCQPVTYSSDTIYWLHLKTSEELALQQRAAPALKAPRRQHLGDASARCMHVFCIQTSNNTDKQHNAAHEPCCQILRDLVIGQVDIPGEGATPCLVPLATLLNHSAAAPHVVRYGALSSPAGCQGGSPTSTCAAAGTPGPPGPAPACGAGPPGGGHAADDVLELRALRPCAAGEQVARPGARHKARGVLCTFVGLRPSSAAVVNQAPA